MNRETRKALSMLMAGGVLMSCMSVTALATGDPAEDNSPFANEVETWLPEGYVEPTQAPETPENVGGVVNVDGGDTIYWDGDPVELDENGNPINLPVPAPLDPDTIVGTGGEKDESGYIYNENDMWGLPVPESGEIYDPGFMVDRDGAMVGGGYGVEEAEKVQSVPNGSKGTVTINPNANREGQEGEADGSLTNTTTEIVALWWNGTSWQQVALHADKDGNYVYATDDFTGNRDDGYVVFLCKPGEGGVITGISADTTNTDENGDRYTLATLIGHQDETKLKDYPELSEVLETYQEKGYVAAFGYHRNNGTDEGVLGNQTAYVGSYKPSLTVTAKADKDKYQTEDTVTWTVTLKTEVLEGLTATLETPTFQVNGKEPTSVNKNDDGTYTVTYKIPANESAEKLSLTVDASVSYDYHVTLTDSKPLPTKGTTVTLTNSPVVIEDSTVPPPGGGESTTPTPEPSDDGDDDGDDDDDEPTVIPSTTPSAEPSPTPSSEPIDIPEETVPLTETPDEVVEIVEEDVPLSDVPSLPQTGLNWLPAILLAVGGASSSAAGLLLQRKKNEEEE